MLLPRKLLALLSAAMCLGGLDAARAAPDPAVEVTLESARYQMRLTTQGEGEKITIVGTYTYTGPRETCRGTLQQATHSKPDRIALIENLREGRCQRNCNLILVDQASGYEEVCMRGTGMQMVDSGRFTNAPDSSALRAVVDLQAKTRLAAVETEKERQKVLEAPMKPEQLAGVLNRNPRAMQTNAETDAVMRNPISATTLCAAGTARACVVLQIYVRFTLMDTSRWSRDEKLAVAKTLRQRCSKEDEEMCYAANSLEFSVAKAEGFRDRNHPRWCLLDSATYTRLQRCFGQDNCVPAGTELSGYELFNSCKVPILYRLTSSFDIDPRVLQPGASARLNTSEKVEWVVRAR